MSTLPDLLRAELLAARRAGDRPVAAALRSTLTSLANAEAVPVDDAPAGASGLGAGQAAGLGAGTTEAERRHVGEAEQVALVHAEIAELTDAAWTYDDVEPARARGARAGIEALERVLADHRD